MTGTSTTHHLVRASAVNGLPVVTIDGGEDAAEIKDVVFDSERHELVGFTLNKRGWFRGTLKQALTSADVESIGGDAVMVSSESALSEPDAAPEPLARSEGHDVLGNTVLTSDGRELGAVVDVILETGPAPTAVGYEVKSDERSVFVPTSAQLSLSGENLIVPPEASDFICNDLAGFGAAVESFREHLKGGPS